MHWLSLGIALLVALAIIVIGVLYVAKPRDTARSFGLPLPEDGPNIAWWLRLEGVARHCIGIGRTGVHGVRHPRGVAIILLVFAITPVGDMLVILAAKGSKRLAFGMHGLTAVFMTLTGILMMTGAP